MIKSMGEVIFMAFDSQKVSDKFLEINACDRHKRITYPLRTLRENGRVDYYIMYILSGYCTVVEDGEEYKAEVGDLIMYLPGERQEYYFDKDAGTSYFFAHFSGKICDEILSACGFTKRINNVGASKKAEMIFGDMVREFHLKKPLWEQVSASCLLQFITTAATVVAEKDGQNGLSQISDAIEYMRSNYEENHSVEFYAKMCHLSESRFSYLFKSAMGISPKQYLQKQKAETAFRLLTSTELSISEISDAVGISDVNYFIRLFKKCMGFTPSVARKKR